MRAIAIYLYLCGMVGMAWAIMDEGDGKWTWRFAVALILWPLTIPMACYMAAAFNAGRKADRP